MWGLPPPPPTFPTPLSDFVSQVLGSVSLSVPHPTLLPLPLSWSSHLMTSVAEGLYFVGPVQRLRGTVWYLSNSCPDQVGTGMGNMEVGGGGV